MVSSRLVDDSSSSGEEENEEDAGEEFEWAKYDLLVAEHREMYTEELVWRGIPR